MRLILIACCLITATTIRSQEIPMTDSYSVNFDRNTLRTRTDRFLTTLTMGGNTVEVDDIQRMYHDLSSRQLVVQPGQQ